MKRFFTLMLAALCICSAVPAALAAGKVYELPEFNMTIEAPEGWIVFTQDIDENDPNLELIGMDGNEFENFLKENDILIYMFKTDPFIQIYLNLKDFESSRDIYDFNDISDRELLSVMDMAMKATAGSMEGTAYTNSSVYKHKQAKFVVFDMADSNNGACGKFYATVINGQELIVTLYLNGNELPDSIAQTVQEVVDSVYFTNITPKPTKLSALLSILKDIAIVAGSIGLIVFIIRKARKKKTFPPGIGGQINGLGK